MGYFWNIFQIFLDVETIFTLLGFQIFLFFIFIPFLCYYWLYLSNQHLGEEYTLKWSPTGTFILVYLNRYHIRVVSTKIWIVDCHAVLLIYNFHTFWGAEKVKNGNLNISVNTHRWIKYKGLLRWILSFLKMSPVETNRRNSRYRDKNWTREISQFLVLGMFMYIWDAKVRGLSPATSSRKFSSISVFGEFILVTPPGVWKILDLCFFK